MPSRTSFFDGRIFRSTLKRTWLLGLGVAAVWVYCLFSRVNGYNRYYMSEEATVGLLRTALREGSLICMVAAAAVAAAVYAWMFFPRATAFYTALPVKREAMFISCAAAGFVILEGGSLLSLPAVALLGGLDGVTANGLFTWVGVVTLMTVLFFGFASLCASLTGNIIILPAVYGVFLFAAVALESSVQRIVQFLIFGLTGNLWKFMAFSPVYYLRVTADRLILTDWESVAREWGAGAPATVKLVGFRAWPLLLVYALAGIVSFLLAVLLIHRRSMESAGETVAVPGLKKLFPWGAALAGALTMGLLTLKLVFRFDGVYSVTGSFSDVLVALFLMLLGAFIGWFGARSLLRKTVRVFNGGWIGFAVFSAVLCVLVLGCEWDLFGIEKSVPDPEKVASVVLWDTYASYTEVEFREKANVEAAAALQKKIIANKEIYESAVDSGLRNTGSALYFTYYDENGNILLTRRYVAPAGPVCWASGGDVIASDGNGTASGGSAAWGSANPALRDLQDLMNVPEGVRQRLTPKTIQPSPATVESAGAYRMEAYMTVDNIGVSPGNAWELYSACILPDAEDGDLGKVQLCPTEAAGHPGDYVNIWITFAKGYGEQARRESFSVPVLPQAERTNRWLADHGLTIPGYEPPVEQQPDPPLSESETHELYSLEGLAALLERVYREYDPAAAGTVGSMRWTNALLEWYASAGYDRFAAYDAARAFAEVYDVSVPEFGAALDTLRDAGLRLTRGDPGLVRDRGRNTDVWSEDTVNDLFEAICAGTGLPVSGE